MIKRVLTAAVALSAIAGMAQAAPTADATLTLSATSPNTCYINGITQGTLATGASFAGGTAGANSSVTLGLGTGVVSPDTAILTATTNVVNVSAYCNYASHNISLRSANGGLVRSALATVEGVFDQRIPYTATLAGWGTTASLSALSANGTLTAVAPSEDTVSAVAPNAVNTTSATITIATTAGTNPLVQGTYSDTLTLRLGATF